MSVAAPTACAFVPKAFVEFLCAADLTCGYNGMQLVLLECGDSIICYN